MWETLIPLLWDALLPILITALTTALSYVGLKIKALYEKYVNTKEKEMIVMHTVQYVEQVFSALKGEEKFQKAKEAALNWLNEKGLAITDTELTILIESSVKALKNGYNKEEK